MEFTIKAQTKNELATKIEKLFGWKKKRIDNYSINFTNFEKIYFHYNNKEYYAHFIDNKKIYNKAINLGVL